MIGRLTAISDHQAKANASPNSIPSDFSWKVSVMPTHKTTPRMETAIRMPRDLSSTR